MLTDAQIDSIWAATVRAEGCQWYGDQEHVCGGTPVPGKHYCPEHFARAYVKNSALSGRRKAKQLEREIRQLEERLALEQAIAEQESDTDEEVEVEIG